LRDTGRFAHVASENSAGRTSLHDLVGQAAGSVTTDLLNVLRSISGFGPEQNQPVGNGADPTADQNRHGVGFGSTEDSASRALKDMLKPRE